MPQKKHTPTYEQRQMVMKLAACSDNGTRKLSHDKIAAFIGISDETLRKYYEEELKAGPIALLLQGLEATELQLAEGNPAIIKMVMGSLGGFADNKKVEIEGSIAVGINAPIAPLSLEEWKREAIEHKKALELEKE